LKITGKFKLDQLSKFIFFLADLKKQSDQAYYYSKRWCKLALTLYTGRWRSALYWLITGVKSVQRLFCELIFRFNTDANGLMVDEFEVKIQLAFIIPEHLPIFGIKTRAYYHGMPKQCGKCYTLGHIKQECQSQPKTWFQYVTELKDQGVPSEHLGNWVERATVNRGRARGQRGQRGRGTLRGGVANRGNHVTRGGARGRGRGRGRGNRGGRGRGFQATN